MTRAIFLFKRELKLRDADFQKRLEEKDEEGRLACEELELRVKALTNSEESKSKLLRDLETRLQAVGADAAKFGPLAEKLKAKESEAAKLEEEKNALEEEVKGLKGTLDNLSKVSETLASAQLELSKLEEEKLALEAKLSTAEEATSGFGEASTNLKAKESELARVAEEMSKLSAEKDSLEQKVSELTSLVEDLETQLNDSKAAGNENLTELAGLRAQLESLLVEVKDKNTALESLSKDRQADLEKLSNDFAKKSGEQQSNFDSQVSTMKDDHKLVLTKFSQKLKDAKAKEKSDAASIESLSADVEQGRKEIENFNRKLDEMSSLLNEKEEMLSKLREEHQSRSDKSSITQLFNHSLGPVL